MASTKRTLADIERDLQHAASAESIARQKVLALEKEKKANDDYQRIQNFKAALGDDEVYAQLFEGDDPLLNFNTMPLAKIDKVVLVLRKWWEKGVHDALKSAAIIPYRPPSPEYVDYDPYDGRPYVVKF